MPETIVRRDERLWQDRQSRRRKNWERVGALFAGSFSGKGSRTGAQALATSMSEIPAVTAALKAIDRPDYHAHQGAP